MWGSSMGSNKAHYSYSFVSSGNEESSVSPDRMAPAESVGITWVTLLVFLGVG